MVVARRARALVDEARVDERDVREPAGGSVGVEARDRASDRQVLWTPQREERDVAEVVTTGAALLGKAVPDRGQAGDLRRVDDAVGLAGVLIDPVRIRLRHDWGEVARERGPVRNRAAEER